MKKQAVFTLAFGFFLLAGLAPPGEAARKYYPPGFTPPSDQAAPAEPAPQVIIQQVPGAKQVIIKTVPVPVKVEKVISQPAKPRDPLLMLLDEHRYFDALRLVDARLKKTPNSLSLQLTRGRILRDQHSFQLAISQFQQIEEKSHARSAKAEAFNGLGWTHYQKALRDRELGDIGGFEASLQNADEAFRQATALQPNFFYAWAGLGRCALANNQVSNAAAWIRKAKKLAPNNTEVQLAEAELLLAQHQPEDALQILYGIKKTTTHDPEVFLLLAKGSLDAGKTDDAIINLKQLLELVPDHTEAFKLLSQSYERKMKPEDAEDVLEKAIALNPQDEKSVESLLKIYDQRNEGDRSVLLLKTLLKGQPGQPAYGKNLMARLIEAGRWDEAYQEGLVLIDSSLNLPEEAPPALPAEVDGERQETQLQLVSLFSRAVYQQGRGLLDQHTLQQMPAIRKARAFSLQSLKAELAASRPSSSLALQNQLNLWLLDPLIVLASLPVDLKPGSPADLCNALQIAFLQGNHALHDRLLGVAERTEDPQAIANRLYEVGDNNGALALVNGILRGNAADVQAKALQETILSAQKNLQEQLASLAMLPRRISDQYWQKAATDALKIGSGDCQTHAAVATVLEKRDHPALALIHQKFAAKYAMNAKDKQYWTQKANRNARNLARTGARQVI